jgi:hypothetical protein
MQSHTFHRGAPAASALGRWGPRAQNYIARALLGSAWVPPVTARRRRACAIMPEGG